MSCASVRHLHQALQALQLCPPLTGVERLCSDLGLSPEDRKVRCEANVCCDPQ